MSKAVKRLIVIGIIVAVLFGAFMISAHNLFYTFDESDFRLTVEVDKTQARVGDTVTVTTTLRNLGRTLVITGFASNITRIEQIISSAVWPVCEDTGFAVLLPGGFRCRFIMWRNSTVTVTREFVIDRALTHEAVARAVFRINGEVFSVDGNQIIIQITG